MNSMAKQFVLVFPEVACLTFTAHAIWLYYNIVPL